MRHLYKLVQYALRLPALRYDGRGGGGGDGGSGTAGLLRTKMTLATE